MGTYDRDLVLRDRRRGKRFPIRESMHYKILGAFSAIPGGTGTTLNFSSTGIQFTTEHHVAVGCSIEVAVDWPAAIDGCALKFVAWGSVVRSSDQWAAMKIEHHEFRTRARLNNVRAFNEPHLDSSMRLDAR